MNKKAINITNKETKKVGFFVGMKKKIIPAFSTVGGNRNINHTAVTYAKYFLSVVF